MASTALKDAARRDLVLRNVATLADAPRVDNRKHQEGFWTADELNLFLSEARGNTWEVCFRLLALTGMRRGEVLGLRWEDVDLDAGLLHIRKQLVFDHSNEAGGGSKLAAPKTKRSRRTISIGPDVVAMLRDHQATQLASHLDSGVGNVLGLVVTGPNGYNANASSVAAEFKKLVSELDVRPITLHGLRHTHATLLLSADRYPLEVSERLGHQSVAFTLDHYGHVIPNDAAAVAQAGEAAVDAHNRWTPQP